MPPSICGICKKECTSVTCQLKWFVLLKSCSSIETLFVSRLAFLKAYAYLKLFGCLTLYIFDSKHFDFRIDVLENLRLSTFSIFFIFWTVTSYLLKTKKYWNPEKGPCIHLRHLLRPKHSKNCYIGGKTYFSNRGNQSNHMPQKIFIGLVNYFIEMKL